MEKLKCVIVDQDKTSVEMLSSCCHDLPYVDVAGRFQDSLKFVRSRGSLAIYFRYGRNISSINSL